MAEEHESRNRVDGEYGEYNEYTVRASKVQKDAGKRRRSKGLESVRNTITGVIVVSDDDGNDNDVTGGQSSPQFGSSRKDNTPSGKDLGGQSTTQFGSSHKGNTPSGKDLKDNFDAHGYASQGGLMYSNNSEDNAATQCSNKDVPLSSQPEQSASITIPSPVYRQLTEEENKLIHFLEVSFQTAVKTRETLDFPDLAEVNDFYNVAMVWFKMFLKFVKTVDDFKKLDIEVQISALKGNIPVCGMFVAAFTFDSEGNSFVIQNIKIGTNDLLRGFAAYGETTERLIQITLSLQDEIFKDPCLIAILELVLVFSPAQDKMNQRKSLSNLQDKYIILLKHYLESKYSYSREKELFALVMGKLWAMKTVTEERRQIVQQIESDRLDPIAKELFQ